MKKYKVFVIEEAEHDLIDIYDYIASNDSIQIAEKILTRLEDACLKLETFPNRGRIVPELGRINITDYLEIISKPYRIIYQIVADKIFIHGVLDSRRDLEELLYDRLIRT